MPRPQPRSALALDVGWRRIGLAGCDPLGLTVSPLPPLARGRFEADLPRLEGLIRSRQVQLLVVGLPLDAAGQPTPQARHCRRYGQQLRRATGLPLVWVNEHSSSWAAGERFGLHGDRSGRLDSAAAAVLLEQWLRDGPAAQSLRDGPAAEPVAPATIHPGPRAGSGSS